MNKNKNTIYDDGRLRLFQDDSLTALKQLPDNTYDAIITDPPYASGGVSSAARAADPSKKYQHSGCKKFYPEFANDQRDQRSHFLWTLEWMREAIRVTKPSGWIMVFTDWRQLPLTSDALQVSGWSWRGILPWDKTEQCRPQIGMFRNQAEYVLYASKGKRSLAMRNCPAGVVREPIYSKDKLHMTAKPIKLMSHLMSILQPDSLILDPFAGSSTTLIAADKMGHRCDGLEVTSDYCAVSKDRLNIHRLARCGDAVENPVILRS